MSETACKRCKYWPWAMAVSWTIVVIMACYVAHLREIAWLYYARGQEYRENVVECLSSLEISQNILLGKPAIPTDTPARHGEFKEDARPSWKRKN